eukprot:8255818-Lingulodinium_polyedra.AAC.1
MVTQGCYPATDCTHLPGAARARVSGHVERSTNSRAFAEVCKAQKGRTAFGVAEGIGYSSDGPRRDI